MWPIGTWPGPGTPGVAILPWACGDLLPGFLPAVAGLNVGCVRCIGWKKALLRCCVRHCNCAARLSQASSISDTNLKASLRLLNPHRGRWPRLAALQAWSQQLRSAISGPRAVTEPPVRPPGCIHHRRGSAYGYSCPGPISASELGSERLDSSECQLCSCALASWLRPCGPHDSHLETEELQAAVVAGVDRDLTRALEALTAPPWHPSSHTFAAATWRS